MRDSIDACLTQAFRNVPVPDGLAERLLAGLAVKQPRRSRRWLLVGGGMLTAAATLFVAIWLNTPKPTPFSEELALDEAIRLFGAGFDGPGHLLTQQPSPAAFPLSKLVVRVPGERWQQLSDFLGCQSVVYRLPGPAGTHAALFVIANSGISASNVMPAANPRAGTAGCCASAWQEGNLLYVLVVQGDDSAYRSYLSLPRTPVA
jgi:hypothetical protein